MMLDSELGQLERADLVRRVNTPATGAEDTAYLFKHALVQDTARASLLLQERKRLNGLVGRALETLYADRPDEYAVLLSQHFEIAGDDVKTCAYAMRAGETALRTNATAEALEHFTRALNAAQRANLDPTEAFLKRGRTLEISDRFPEALENYHAMQTYGREKKLPALELGGMMACATVHSIPSMVYDLALADTLGEQALALARALGDKRAEAKILWNRVLQYSRADVRYRQAVQIGEHALAIARAENLGELTAYLLNDLAPTYAFLGDAERAERYNLEARAMWREANNLPMLTDNLGYAVMVHMFQTDYRGAIDASRQSVKISREIGNLWGEAFAQTWVGVAYWEFGEIGTAYQVMENAIALAAYTFPAPLVLTAGDLARLLSDVGDRERALQVAQQAVAKAQAMFPAMHPWAQGALAYVHLRRGELEAAFELVRDVPLEFGADGIPLFQWERLRVRVECMLSFGEWETARAQCEQILQDSKLRQGWLYGIVFLVLKARALRALGNETAALEVLTEAETLCRAGDSQWSLWQILALEGQLYAQSGQFQAAQSARAEARLLIESVAARTPEPLRAGFLEFASSHYEF